MPRTKEIKPPIIAFIRHFRRFIFSSKARESLSNCIDISAIISDFRDAESSSVILSTILFRLPFMMSSSYSTLLLRLSTLLLALNSLTRSSILYLSFSLSLLRGYFLSTSAALFRKLEAKETEEASVDTNSICVSSVRSAELQTGYDVAGSTIPHWQYFRIPPSVISWPVSNLLSASNPKTTSGRDWRILKSPACPPQTTRNSLPSSIIPLYITHYNLLSIYNHHCLCSPHFPTVCLDCPSLHFGLNSFVFTVFPFVSFFTSLSVRSASFLCRSQYSQKAGVAIRVDGFC